jgi:glucose-specific phosphotransferase system IIA component
MGLGGLFKKRDDVETSPAPLVIEAHEGEVLAPVSGVRVELGNVSDPVFSQGLMGVGVGIVPRSDVVYAPVAGTVAATTKTNHAISLTSDGGVEVLVHVGVDTVMLRGAGFSRFVEKGDHVEAGTALITFDRSAVAEHGLDSTVIVTVLNSDAYPSVELLATGPVAAGDVVMHVGA